MEKTVVILTDFVGCGDVAMSTARTILTKMGCVVYCLPTALISNTWSMGTPAVLDTTSYLEQALAAWENMHICPDAVLVGYLAGEDQAERIARWCRRWQSQGARIFYDPIFADNGKLYRGMEESRLDFIRAFLPLADYILPNVTEASFLAGSRTCTTALERLVDMGARHILMTSVAVDDQHKAVLLWDGRQQTFLNYVPVPGEYGGAGDAFAAQFVGHILEGKPMIQSAREAMDLTREWILRARELPQRPCPGLPVEQFF